jgi:MFS transporter, DHA2 family, multidrug resistance protein
MSSSQSETIEVNPKRWAILAVLVTSLVVVILDNTVLNVALKTIQQALGATQSQLIWAINSYVLVFAALLFTWGVLGDRYGRRRILIIGLILFGIASAVSAFSTSPEMLIITRGLMGIGAASVLPVTLAIITVVFPPHERGKAIGFWAAAVGGSVALGPIVAGLLLERFWWGSVFLINVPVVILGVIGIIALVPESKNPAAGKLDPVGVVLSIVGLMLLVYGIVHAGDTGDWAAVSTWGSILAGVLILVLFVWLESRNDHAALDLALFRIKSFSVPLLATTLTFAAMSGSLLFLAFYQQIVRGLTPLQAGVQTLPVAVGQLLAAPNSARLVNKFGFRKVVITGLVITSLAFTMFTLLTPATATWQMLVIFFVLGYGLGNTIAPSTAQMTMAIPAARSGAGSAVQNTVRQVGAALGVALISTLVATIYGNRMTAGLTSSGIELSAELNREIADSVGGAFGATELLAQSGELSAAKIEQLRMLAIDSYMESFHTAVIVGAVVVLIALVVMIWQMPKTSTTAPWEMAKPATAESSD